MEGTSRPMAVAESAARGRSGRGDPSTAASVGRAHSFCGPDVTDARRTGAKDGEGGGRREGRSFSGEEWRLSASSSSLWDEWVEEDRRCPALERGESSEDEESWDACSKDGGGEVLEGGGVHGASVGMAGAVRGEEDGEEWAWSVWRPSALLSRRRWLSVVGEDKDDPLRWASSSWMLLSSRKDDDDEDRAKVFLFSFVSVSKGENEEELGVRGEESAKLW